MIAVQQPGQKVRVSLVEAFAQKAYEQKMDAERDSLGRVVAASPTGNANSDLLEIFKTKKKDIQSQKDLAKFLATTFNLDADLVLKSIKEFEEKRE